VDEWALDDFSAHLNGTFVCSSTAYFHVTFMNSRYVQIEVCYKHRNSHISGMLTRVCVFVHVQMETQICGNSWYYPPPLTHALLSFACFTLRSGTRVWTCSLISGLLCIFSLLKKQHITSAAPMMIVSFSPSTHLVRAGYVPFPPYQNGFVLCV